jgi:hypothetical protein
MRKRKSMSFPINHPKTEPKRRGRPRKVEYTAEEIAEREIKRTVQTRPYNSTGEVKKDWVKLKKRLIAFINKEKRPNLANALLFLLDKALTEFETPKPESILE